MSGCTGTYKLRTSDGSVKDPIYFIQPVVFNGSSPGQNANELRDSNSTQTRKKSCNFFAKAKPSTKGSLLWKESPLVKERSIIFINLWGLGWPFYFSWICSTLVSLLNFYVFTRIDTRCWLFKPCVLYMSACVSTFNIFESLITLLAFVVRHKWNFFYELSVYYILCSLHIVTTFINFLTTTVTFIQKSCNQEQVIPDVNSEQSENFFDFLLLRYDVKLSGVLHLVISVSLTITLVYFAVHKDQSVYDEVKRINSKRAPNRRIIYP